MAETSGQIQLREEDLRRVLELRAEVQSRVDELATIGARVLGLGRTGATGRNFRLRDAERNGGRAAEIDYIEIVVGDAGVEYHDVCFVYCTPDIAVVESPCGSGGAAPCG